MGLLSIVMLVFAQAAPAAVRSLNVTVVDDKGAPIQGLSAEDVAVVENGVAREVTKLSLDRRPLAVTLLVDSSEAASSAYRLTMVPAVLSFLRQLPEGSTFSIWTTGDRPTKVVDFVTDVAQAERALKRVFPQGGNTMLDALVEASEPLRRKEAERTAVVAVTSLGIEFSNRHRTQVVDQAKDAATVFMAVQFDEGESRLEDRQNYEYVLSSLTRSTGGLYETVLSSLGVPSALEKIASDLRAQYRISYTSPADAKEGKIEVKVARPGARVRVGRPGTRPEE
jgi:VWFA-related protein